MDSSGNELYLGKGKGKRQTIKVNDFNSLVSKLSEFQHTLTDSEFRFEENRRNEVLQYRKMAVEANTLPDLHKVEKLIQNRISILLAPEFNEFPALTDIREELESILKHAQFKVLEIESQNNCRAPAKPRIKRTFEELFRDKADASNVKQILECKGYTENGAWQGLTTDKQELLTIFYVLKPLLKPIKSTSGARIFYKEFRLPPDYISERMFTIEPFPEYRNEIESIFSGLLS